MGPTNRWLNRLIARTITSPRVDQLNNLGYALQRKIIGAQPTIFYFHQMDDPYSQLAASLLPALRDRYAVNIKPYIVAAPDEEASPDRHRLARWAVRDVKRLSQRLGLQPVFEVPAWSHGDELRRQLGHYAGAMFYFEGTWYWGIDRLHYLEDRLIRSGLGSQYLMPLIAPPELQWMHPEDAKRGGSLHFFCSLRSPYTWLAIQRLRQLTAHYQLRLRIKFVLPMVMRGLQVPLAKRLYIMRDAKREATRLDLSFGDVVDPLGTPVERGLAILHRALALGYGLDFLESFLSGVFAEGIDAGTEQGLFKLVHRAGMSQKDMIEGLADTSWRQVAELNRQELLDLGLWGVPSFYLEGMPALWGQDRLWMIEEDICTLSLKHA